MILKYFKCFLFLEHPSHVVTIYNLLQPAPLSPAEWMSYFICIVYVVKRYGSRLW